MTTDPVSIGVVPGGTGLLRDLRGWWKFDETAGTTAADSSPYGNTGTLVNFPGDGTEWVDGRAGGALEFRGVPSNDFGRQEPGTDAEIQKFCKTNYKVTFPMLSKVSVAGDGKVPLYQYLTSKQTSPKFGQDQEVKWNFEKFLIGRTGEIVGRFQSGDEPDSDRVVKAITAELEKK